jgi:hypothetical protein
MIDSRHAGRSGVRALSGTLLEWFDALREK